MRAFEKRNLPLGEREPGPEGPLCPRVRRPEMPGAMKILHCLHQYHPARGGAEWLMKNVSERLRAAGHEVRVISTNAWSMEDYSVRGCGKSRMRAGEETIGGVPVRRVPFTRAGAAFFRAARASANRGPL